MVSKAQNQHVYQGDSQDATREMLIAHNSLKNKILNKQTIIKHMGIYLPEEWKNSTSKILRHWREWLIQDGKTTHTQGLQN